MGRKEKRKAGRDSRLVDRIPEHQLKKQVNKAIEKEIEEAKREMLNRAVHDLTAAFILSLWDTFGFGRKRLTRLLEKVSNQFDCILNDYVTIEDIKAWCKERGFEYEDIFQDGR